MEAGTIAYLVAFGGFIILMLVWMHHRMTKMYKAGYEALLKAGKKGSRSSLYEKDDALYYNQGINPRRASQSK